MLSDKAIINKYYTIKTKSSFAHDIVRILCFYDFILQEEYKLPIDNSHYFKEKHIFQKVSGMSIMIHYCNIKEMRTIFQM